MKDVCTVKKCVNYSKTFCRLHSVGISVKKQPKPIAPRSKKLEEVMKKEYRPEVKEMVQKNTPCKVQSPICTKIAQGFHHLAGRLGTLLTDKKKKVPCCNACNTFIEKNDAWARSNGWKESKFSQPISKRAL